MSRHFLKMHIHVSGSNKHFVSNTSRVLWAFIAVCVCCLKKARANSHVHNMKYFYPGKSTRESSIITDRNKVI